MFKVNNKDTINSDWDNAISRETGPFMVPLLLIQRIEVVYSEDIVRYKNI